MSFILKKKKCPSTDSESSTTAHHFNPHHSPDCSRNFPRVGIGRLDRQEPLPDICSFISRSPLPSDPVHHELVISLQRCSFSSPEHTRPMANDPSSYSWRKMVKMSKAYLAQTWGLLWGVQVPCRIQLPDSKEGGCVEQLFDA